DLDGFEAFMSQQRERSRQSSKFTADYHVGAHLECSTEFIGYHELVIENAKIMALYQNDKSVSQLNAGEKGSIILDKTPFYAESGGQVGDQGNISLGEALFEVLDTQKQGNAFVHIGYLKS